MARASPFPIPLATCISDYGYTADPQREWKTFVVRKQAKDHGLGKLIEGHIQSGEHALIVDDVLTTGGSILKAAEAARQQQLTVTHSLVEGRVFFDAGLSGHTQ